MSSNDKRGQSNLLFFKQFQFWFILRFTAYTAAYLLVFFLGLFVWFQMLVNEFLNLSGLFSKEFVQNLHFYSWLGIGILILLLVVLVALSAFQAIFFSRRIAGPIFAFSRHLDQCIESGKVTPFKLRTNDHFQELAENFNRFAAKS